MTLDRRPDPPIAVPASKALSGRHPAREAAKTSRRTGSRPGPDVIENTVDAQCLVRLLIPAHELDAVSAALRTEQAHAQRRQSSTFDSPDRALAAHGVFLSLCRRGREWVQVAVATTPDCTRLLVHEVDLGTRGAGVVPAILPHLHDGTAVGAALSAALAGARVAGEDESSLAVSFRTDLTRLARQVTLEGAVVEIAQVTGMITTDDASASFQELEIRLVSGALAPLFAIARTWAARHGLPLGSASNGERGARLAAGDAAGFPTVACPPEPPFIDGAGFLRATLDSCLSHLLANASIVGEGSLDRHVIDELRDGLQRTRTAIVRLAPLASGMDDAWEPVLQRTFHELAAHRGATAISAPLMQAMRAAGLAYALGSSQPRESRSAAAIVCDPEFQSTLMAILAYRHDLAPPFGPRRGSLQQMQHRFARELRACSGAVEADATDLRSKSKRRRANRHLAQLYRLATFIGPLYPPRRVDRLLGRCRAAQDAFATDAEDWLGLTALEDDGDGGTDVTLARRWLASRLVEDRRQCKALLHRVGRAKPFWR